MFNLKPLSASAVPAALEKANRYRLLNEPGAAESICLDVLEVEPSNQEALVMLVLAMSDRLDKGYAVGDTHIQDYIARIADEYARTYYTGIVYVRRAKAELHRAGLNAYELFRQAMEWFERAEAIRPPGNDDAILHWNRCARMIAANKLEPRDMGHDFLE
jgi:hypothetical protein